MDDPPSTAMPRWIPVLIGGILGALGVLAVYTGVESRDDNTLLSHVRPQRPQRQSASAPPGAPEAGASLVLQGDSGETTPPAHEAVQGAARAVVTGGPGGVTAVVRLWARRGMVLTVVPSNTMIYVNDLPIGEAGQFDTMEEAYEFAAAGSYTVRLVPSQGAEKTYIVTASDDAEQDVARIVTKF